MSSFDKVVKLACKPKAAAPKPKYLEPILAATWSEDGAVHDVCKALSPRFREPNAIVVFKALIVLHTMIRNGATDNVLSYLSSGEILRLSNVSAGNWEGYNAPQNLQNYATYLDSRIRAYRDLKHDAVRVQAESNRDLRNNNAIDEDMAYRSGPKAPSRSKTVSGRKLRVMKVEKGLLRETKVVQRMIDSLVECRFYLDDLEDELTITALRMLVKDLLVLFQAGNEGVINVLEHYFEMSHVDASAALQIYRQFCAQTERVVEYLGVAKKLQNLLNVPIPNLKHAPVSLVGALEEYLKDPNFEQNRSEYKSNRQVADSASGAGVANGSVSSKAKVSFAETKKPEKVSKHSMSAPESSGSKPASSQAMQDFFSAIEEEQPTMFNPQTGSPTANYFQQQAAQNPFAAFATQPTGIQQQLQQQQTGFMMPQQTAFQLQTQPFPPQTQQPNPFGLQPPQQQQHRPFSTFLQTQNTGFVPPQPTGLLQPQATGSNPFRQSMMLPPMPGFAPSPSPFAMQSQLGQTPFSASPFAPSGSSSTFAPTPSFSASPFAQNLNNMQKAAELPARPASTPLTSFGASTQPSSTSPPAAQPVKSHQTGSRNPFGIPVAPPPPVPKQPTLMELYMGNAGALNSPNGNSSSQPQQQQQQQQQPQQQSGSFGGPSWAGAFGSGSNGKTDMASIASSFSLNKGPGEQNNNPTSLGQPSINDSSGHFPFLSSQNTSTTVSGSGFSDSLFSSLSSQPTGATTTSGAPSISLSPALKPQSTGFTGMKAFKPTSSFGASLIDSLPITGSNPTAPGVTGNPSPAGTSTTISQPAGAAAFGGSPFGSQPTSLGSLNSQPTGAPFGAFGGGSTLGAGLRPQMTGGAANPFRTSMFTNATGAPMNGSMSSFTPNSFPVAAGQTGAFNGAPFGAFSTQPFGSSTFQPNGSSQDPSKQHNPNASLI